MKKAEKDSLKYTILGMHSKGMSIPEICAATGASEHFVGDVIKENGLKPNVKRAYKLSESQKALIIDLIKSGESASAAARKVVCSDTSAQNVWREYKRACEAGDSLDISAPNQTTKQSRVAQIITGLEMVLEGIKGLE